METQSKVLVFAAILLVFAAFFYSIDSEHPITGRFFNLFQDEKQNDEASEESQDVFMGVSPSIANAVLDEPLAYYFNVYPGEMNDFVGKEESSLFKNKVLITTKAPNEELWTIYPRIGLGALDNAMAGSIPFYIDNSELPGISKDNPTGENIIRIEFFDKEHDGPIETQQFSVFNRIGNSNSLTGMAGNPPMPVGNPPAPKPQPAGPVTTPGAGGTTTPTIDDEPTVEPPPKKVPPYCICTEMKVAGTAGDNSIPKNILDRLHIGDTSLAYPFKVGLGAARYNDANEGGQQYVANTFVVSVKVEGDIDKCEEFQRYMLSVTNPGGTSYAAGPAPWYKALNYDEAKALENEYTRNGWAFEVPITSNKYNPAANTYHPDSFDRAGKSINVPTTDGKKKSIPSKEHVSKPSSGTGEAMWADPPMGGVSTGVYRFEFHGKVTNLKKDGTRTVTPECDLYWATNIDTYNQQTAFFPANKNAIKVQSDSGWPLSYHYDNQPFDKYK